MLKKRNKNNNKINPKTTNKDTNGHTHLHAEEKAFAFTRVAKKNRNTLIKTTTIIICCK